MKRILIGTLTKRNETYVQKLRETCKKQIEQKLINKCQEGGLNWLVKKFRLSLKAKSHL